MDDGSHAICLESDEARILEHREAVDLGIPHFKAHLSIFVPAVGVSFLYLAFWTFLFFTGSSSGWVAQLFIASLAIVLPLLLAAAFLRYQTIRAQLIDDFLVYHPGWPKDIVKELPISTIRSVDVKKGIADSMFGSGDLVVLTQDGDEIVIENLKSPDALLSLIQLRLQSGS